MSPRASSPQRRASSLELEPRASSLKPAVMAVVVVWWLACVAWSSTWLFIRLGLREIPPFTFASMRLGIALAVLAPLAWRQARAASLTRRDTQRLVATGLLLLGVNYALVFWGVQFIPSGLGAILQATSPVFALALGWLLGSEAVSLAKVFGLAAGLAGVVTIFGAEARVSGADAVVGSAAVLSGALCVAAAYVFVKTYSSQVRPLPVMAVQTLAAIVPLASAALILEGVPEPATWSGASWAALLYLALVGSVVAFWLNYWLLQRLDTSAMLMMVVAQVPISVLLGAVFLGERLSLATLAGAALVLTGVVAVLLGTRGRRRRIRRPP
jgi:drug/metabolite transporter (DMT)-like permease